LHGNLSLNEGFASCFISLRRGSTTQRNPCPSHLDTPGSAVNTSKNAFSPTQVRTNKDWSTSTEYHRNNPLVLRAHIGRLPTHRRSHPVECGDRFIAVTNVSKDFGCSKLSNAVEKMIVGLIR
jgi:hypothetical protein